MQETRVKSQNERERKERGGKRRITFFCKTFLCFSWSETFMQLFFVLFVTIHWMSFQEKERKKKPYLKFKGFFPDFSLTILSLFIKVSYLFSFKCIYFDIDGINTQNTFSRGLNTTPLIHHVFNVEQDQIIRDNVFDIRAWIVWEKTQRERKTKDSQSHELSRKCSMAPKGSGLFFSMSPSTMKSIEDASEHFFFKTLDLPQWSIA